MESVIDTQTLANFINSNSQTVASSHHLVSSASVEHQHHHIHQHLHDSAVPGNINYINSHGNICAMSSDECINNNVIFYYSSSASNNVANKVSNKFYCKEQESYCFFFSKNLKFKYSIKSTY